MPKKIEANEPNTTIQKCPKAIFTTHTKNDLNPYRDDLPVEVGLMAELQKQILSRNWAESTHQLNNPFQSPFLDYKQTNPRIPL